MGSKCKPREGIGIALSHIEALFDEAESNLAFSTLEVVDSSKFMYLLTYIGLSHSDWNIIF